MDSFEYESFLPFGPVELPFHLFKLILSFFPPIVPKIRNPSPGSEFRSRGSKQAGEGERETRPEDISIPQSSPSHSNQNTTYINVLGSVCSIWRQACCACFGTIFVLLDQGILPSDYPEAALFEFAHTVVFESTECKRIPDSEIRHLVSCLNPGRLKRILAWPSCKKDKSVARAFRVLESVGWWKRRQDAGFRGVSVMGYGGLDEVTFDENHVKETEFQFLVRFARIANRARKVFDCVETVLPKVPDPNMFRHETTPVLRGSGRAVGKAFPNVKTASLILSLLVEKPWSETLRTLNLVKIRSSVALEVFRSDYSRVSRLSGLDPFTLEQVSGLDACLAFIAGRRWLKDVTLKLDTVGVTPILVLGCWGRGVSNVTTLRINLGVWRARVKQIPELVSNGRNVEHVVLSGSAYPMDEGVGETARLVSQLLQVRDRTMCLSLHHIMGAWIFDSPFRKLDHMSSTVARSLLSSNSDAKAKRLAVCESRCIERDGPGVMCDGAFHKENLFLQELSVTEDMSKVFLFLSIHSGFGLGKGLAAGSPFCAEGTWEPQIGPGSQECFVKDPFVNWSTISLITVIEKGDIGTISVLCNVEVVDSPVPGKWDEWSYPEDLTTSFQTDGFRTMKKILEDFGYRLQILKTRQERGPIVGSYVRLLEEIHCDRIPEYREDNSCVFHFAKVSVEGRKTSQKDRRDLPLKTTLAFLVRMLETKKERATEMLLANREESALKLLQEARLGLLHVQSEETSMWGQRIGLSISLNMTLCNLRLHRFKDCLVGCRALLRYRKAQMSRRQLAKVYCRIGRCWEAYGKRDKERRSYQLALETMPNCSIARQRLAELEQQ